MEKYAWFPKTLGFDLLPWALPLIAIKDKRYKIVHGGRMSSKSTCVGIALLTIATFKAETRVAVVREHAITLDKSVITLFKRLIKRSAVAGEWKAYRNFFENKMNGSVIFGQGFSDRTRENLKGLEDVNYVWIEEAQLLSEGSWEYLDPTIREPGAEIWATMNPHKRLQPIYKNFVMTSNSDAWVRQVNFDENPYLPPENLRAIENFKRDYPERFNHVYLGEPDDIGEERVLIPYNWLRDCVSLYSERDKLPSFKANIGMDIADTGVDLTAICVRNSAAVDEIHQHKCDPVAAADLAFNKLYKVSGESISIDGGGVGAGTRAALERKPAYNYYLYPVHFGQKPELPDSYIARGIKHGDIFHNIKAQMGFNLRRRAENSVFYLQGRSVPLHDCLMINPEIKGLEFYLAQLGQPQWEEKSDRKIQIDKTPDNLPSPDMYDATCLAFYEDCRRGFTMPEFGPVSTIHI